MYWAGFGPPINYTVDMPYIYSTLTSDNLYTSYSAGGGDMPIPGRQVLVKGGTGLANDRLITPLGVATEVTAEDLDLLKTIPAFLEHQKNGHIVVDAKKQDPEKVASGMKTRDGSAPRTDADFPADNQPK